MGFCYSFRPVLRYPYMKIMSFNTWGGRVGEPLKAFFSKHSDDVDIFCLQEVFKGAGSDVVQDLTASGQVDAQLFETIASALPNHDGYFCPVYKDAYGIACFVRKGIKVLKQGELVLAEGENFLDPEHPGADHTRNLQWLVVQEGDKTMFVSNIHGHWAPGDKSDREESDVQTQRIFDLLKDFPEQKVLCGDFNLHPKTKSIQKFDEVFRNLIVENNITSTRTPLFHWPQKFADYIFTSPELNVKSFEVLPDEVSDHSALVVEIG